VIICIHNGHLEEEPEGVYCPQHGTPLFSDCPKCGQPWTTVGLSMYDEVGSDFCVHCAHPAPWVSREKRLAWIKGRLHQEGLDEATELELREALDRIKDMDPNDTRTIAAWQKLRDVAPKLWDIAKPIVTVSGSEPMVTHAGPFPAGPPAAATLAASENGLYVGYALRSRSFYAHNYHASSRCRGKGTDQYRRHMVRNGTIFANE